MPDQEGPGRQASWATTSLSLVANSISSGTTTSRLRRGQYPLYGSTGRIGYTNQPEFRGASILVARVGANAGSVYRVSGSYGVSDNTLVVRLKPPRNVTFFEEVLRAHNLNASVYGSGQPLVTGTMLKHLSVPDLPLSEEAAIADVLGDANMLIASLKRLIAKKQAIKVGMAQELLSGRTRLPGFTEAWEPRRLSDMLSYEQPTSYLVSNTDYVRSGTPVLTAGKTFVLGYTTDGHGIYRAVPVIIFDDFTTASKLVMFPFKAKSSAMKILSATAGTSLRFIYERMQLINFQAVDHKRHWISEYSKLEFSVPSEAEQHAIGAVLTDADAEIDLLKRRLEKAEAIKKGIVQQLLTGRVRLPDLEAVA